MENSSLRPRARRRALTLAAAATGLTVAVLGLPSPAMAAAPSATVTPASGPVGTSVKVTGNCGDDQGLGRGPSVRIGLYYPDATSTTAGADTFTEATSPLSASGDYSGSVKVPAKATYAQGVAGTEVTKAVTGKVSVQVLCSFKLTAFPSFIQRKDAFTVTAATATTKKVFTVSKAPRIKGTKKVGKKLTAKHGKWSPKPTKFTYQWKRGKKVIKGATKVRYTVKPADAGKKISVKVTGTKKGYKKLTRKSKAVRIKR